jgi:hypothetical protein
MEDGARLTAIVDIYDWNVGCMDTNRAYISKTHVARTQEPLNH